MKRRSFLAGLGTGLVSTPALLQRAAAQVQEAALIPERDYEAMDIDANPIGGYLTKPEKQVLFTDYRHIEAGDLVWLSPEGKVIPVAGPPGDPVAVRADLEMVPRGIRLQAMKPTMEGWACFRWPTYTLDIQRVGCCSAISMRTSGSIRCWWDPEVRCDCRWRGAALLRLTPFPVTGCGHRGQSSPTLMGTAGMIWPLFNWYPSHMVFRHGWAFTFNGMAFCNSHSSPPTFSRPTRCPSTGLAWLRVI